MISAMDESFYSNRCYRYLNSATTVLIGYTEKSDWPEHSRYILAASWTLINYHGSRLTIVYTLTIVINTKPTADHRCGHYFVLLVHANKSNIWDLKPSFHNHWYLRWIIQEPHTQGKYGTYNRLLHFAVVIHSVLAKIYLSILTHSRCFAMWA